MKIILTYHRWGTSFLAYHLPQFLQHNLAEYQKQHKALQLKAKRPHLY